MEPEALVLTVLELDGGTYGEVSRVSGDEVFEEVRPFPVRAVPADLSR